MPNLITSKYPPVNGNICEKFVAISSDLAPVSFEWDEEQSSFVIKHTAIDVTYSHLEKNYVLFIWESEL